MLACGRGSCALSFAPSVMQVNGGSQSFNAVNGLRILGRWMRMVTIPNQSSVPKVRLCAPGLLRNDSIKLCTSSNGTTCMAGLDGV